MKWKSRVVRDLTGNNTSVGIQYKSVKLILQIKNSIFINICFANLLSSISIGDGSEKNNLNKLIKEMKLDNNTVFLDNISEDLKLSLIASSNLFLMPSIIDKKSVEGFGISYIEAASYGVASIGGKDGGASDAIINNKTGLICDGNKLESIYEAVTNFIENDKFKEFGIAARKFSEKFYWDKIVKNYLNLI